MNGYNFLNIKHFFIYLWKHWVSVAALGLSPGVVSGGLLFIVVLRFFTGVASLVELRLYLGCSGLLTLWHVRSSCTRDPIHTPCIVRQILNLWTKEVQMDIIFEESLYFKGKFESDDPTCLVIFNFTKYV